MKLWRICLTCAAIAGGLLISSGRAVSQDAPDNREPATVSPVIPVSPAPSVPMNDLERKFSETLNNAALEGHWRLIEEGRLGEERRETYRIHSATKTGDDEWVVMARVQYGNRDVTVPVPVQVKWAGDTPVISVTNLAIPGLGTYTARVLVYEHLYTGTWSGPRARGVMQGTVQKQEAQQGRDSE